MCSPTAAEEPRPQPSERLRAAVRDINTFAARRPATPEWVLDVTGIIAELEEMNRVTEADFLAVGEKLMGILSAAREIRADFGRLAELISGEHAESECNALTTVFGRATEM